MGVIRPRSSWSTWASCRLGSPESRRRSIPSPRAPRWCTWYCSPSRGRRRSSARRGAFALCGWWGRPGTLPRMRARYVAILWNAIFLNLDHYSFHVSFWHYRLSNFKALENNCIECTYTLHSSSPKTRTNRARKCDERMPYDSKKGMSSSNVPSKSIVKSPSEMSTS